jgi:hypothetical protein
MNKAERAANILRDDFFVEEIERLKQSYMDMIARSNPEDIDTREDAYKMHHSITKIMDHFQAIADDKLVEEKRWKIF